MKTFLLITALFSHSLFAQVEKSPLLSQWSIVMEGSKGGNQIRSLERKITTPYSRYTVAQVTMMDLNFEGDQDLESTRSFLSKEFKLQGLQEKSLGKSFRFEGYNKALNRQVVVFVSFSTKRIRVSTSFYRPSYGNKITLETELIHRKYHEVNDKYSFIKYLKLSLPFIESAHASTIDCSLCSGNPTCIMLCKSSTPTSAPETNVGTSSMSLSDITSQLQSTNSSVSALTSLSSLTDVSNKLADVGSEASSAIKDAGASVSLSIDGAGVSIGNAGDKVATSIDNAGTKVSSSIDDASTKVSNSLDSASSKVSSSIDGAANKASDAIGSASDKLSGSLDKATAMADEKADKALALFEETNKKLDDFTATVDKNGVAINASAEKANENWAKTNEIAEKMSDPNHLFKLAAFSAAGAVIGGTVANMAISGVTNAVGFLIKWATGELKTMKQEELLKEFNQALKVYEESSEIAKKLEVSIDGVLNNMALHQKFKMDNSDVMTHIQKTVIETQFKLDDAIKDRCVDDIIALNQTMVEYQSLSKILSMADPQKKMCENLNEMFRKLAEIEGILQNARPNLLKAEEALNWQKARSQNKGAKTLAKIREGKLAREVRSTQEEQREKLFKQNKRDTQELTENVQDDCRESFKALSSRPDKKVVREYCSSLLQNKDNIHAIPGLSPQDQALVQKEFKKKYISLSLEKISTYDKQRDELFRSFDEEMDRHEEASMNLKDKLQMDPRIALDEMKAINLFSEKLMKEQAYIYSDGLKAKKAQFDEACRSLAD